MKITISDDLAAVLEERREQGGFPTLDAVAEAAIAKGIAALDDHADGRGESDLRAFIDAADASGAEIVWDAAAVKAEVLRRYAERSRRA